MEIQLKNNILAPLLLLLLIPIIGYSQTTTTATVLDAYTKEPLMGVSVFYDGTSIGVITDSEGNFSITAKKKITASLVLSYIGYKSKILNSPINGSLGTIFLEEATVELNEVVLKPDTWSRKKKLRYFRREFLGNLPSAKECKILNEKDIRLYYSKSENVLYAYANTPIYLENKFLGYTIAYNLEDFELEFKRDINGHLLVHSVYYAGTSLFTEMNEKVKKKHKENRERAFYGSRVHFMRALSQKRLKQEKFRIFKGRQEVKPYEYLLVTKVDALAKVEQTIERLNILYNKRSNSYIIVNEKAFFIDEFGNHWPSQDVLFGGAMGLLRIGNLLPLNYNLN